MSRSKQHIILCEGFDDRAFWAGWLQNRLACADPTRGGSRAAIDAHGDPVQGKGRFLFRSANGSSIVVWPYGGLSKLGKALSEILRDQVNKPIDRLILNLDSDELAAGEPSPRDRLRTLAHSHGVEVTDPTRPFDLAGIRTCRVIWECDDPPETPGLPQLQTLERLVCAAVRAAFEDRGPAVDRWLHAEPVASTSHKSFAYSYLAKWYASHGANDFLRQIWREEVVATELELRLGATGAAAAVHDLVND